MMQNKTRLMWRILILVLILGIGTTACTKQDKVEETENLVFKNTYHDMDALVQSLNSKYNEQEAVVHITYKHEENAEIKFKIINEDELDIVSSLVLLKEVGYQTENHLSGKNQKKLGDKEYKLTCTSGGTTTTKTCSGVFSCKKFASNCLDNDGCLTVCPIRDMVYIPSQTIKNPITKETVRTLPEIILMPIQNN